MNYKDQALKLVENEFVTATHLLLCCLTAMSQDDVEQMLDANELSPRFQEDQGDNS
jgi:hypothetical protein